MINRLEPPRLAGTFEQVKSWLQQAYRRFVQIDSGSFTGTLTGMTASTTGTVDYTIIGDIVTLSIASNITGTSNATTMTMTGMPADLWPSGSRYVFARLRDNTTGTLQGLTAIDSSGTITFSYGITSGLAFTAANTKGLLTCTMVYKQ